MGPSSSIVCPSGIELVSRLTQAGRERFQRESRKAKLFGTDRRSNAGLASPAGLTNLT